jgi:hypothetical protein
MKQKLFFVFLIQCAFIYATVSIKDTGTLNVTSSPFNADNSGTIDATEAIQAAISNLDPEKGGCIFFPAGNYLIKGTIYCFNTKTKRDIMNLLLKGTGIGRINLILTRQLNIHK